ncbi:hypothetical protein GCM10027027_18460 [Neomicrococcus lactis]
MPPHDPDKACFIGCISPWIRPIFWTKTEATTKNSRETGYPKWHEEKRSERQEPNIAATGGKYQERQPTDNQRRVEPLPKWCGFSADFCGHRAANYEVSDYATHDENTQYDHEQRDDGSARVLQSNVVAGSLREVEPRTLHVG